MEFDERPRRPGTDLLYVRLIGDYFISKRKLFYYEKQSSHSNCLDIFTIINSSIHPYVREFIIAFNSLFFSTHICVANVECSFGDDPIQVCTAKSLEERANYYYKFRFFEFSISVFLAPLAGSAFVIT